MLDDVAKMFAIISSPTCNLFYSSDNRLNIFLPTARSRMCIFVFQVAGNYSELKELDSRQFTIDKCNMQLESPIQYNNYIFLLFAVYSQRYMCNGCGIIFHFTIAILHSIHRYLTKHMSAFLANSEVNMVAL
jgi:hypothetical protein